MGEVMLYNRSRTGYSEISKGGLMGKIPFESTLPEDSVPVKNIGSWGFYTSLSDHSIYIKTDDYHPDALRVTKKDLLDLIAIIDQSVQRAGQEILAELETACGLKDHLREIIEKEPSREVFNGAKIKLVMPD
jgi:hypothetical protein